MGWRDCPPNWEGRSPHPLPGGDHRVGVPRSMPTALAMGTPSSKAAEVYGRVRERETSRSHCQCGCWAGPHPGPARPKPRRGVGLSVRHVPLSGGPVGAAPEGRDPDRHRGTTGARCRRPATLRICMDCTSLTGALGRWRSPPVLAPHAGNHSSTCEKIDQYHPNGGGFRQQVNVDPGLTEHACAPAPRAGAGGS